MKPGRKYVLDTNIFIRAFRDEAANDALAAFRMVFAPGEYLSSVVAQELRAGIRSQPDRRKLERLVIARYERVGRVVTPSAAAWHASGDALSALRKRDGLELGRVSKSFGNDLLLALSCREAGLTLITENHQDFERIARVVHFAFAVLAV